MTTPTPADRAAERIYEAEWSTRQALWPGVEEVAQIITCEYAPMVEACRVALEKAQLHYRKQYARNTEELTTMATPYCNALELLKESK